MRQKRIVKYVSEKVRGLLSFASNYSFSYWEKHGLIRVYVENEYGKDKGYIQVYPYVKVRLDISITYNRQLKEIFEKEEEIIKEIINENEQPVEREKKIIKIDNDFFVLVLKDKNVGRKYMIASICVLNYYGKDYPSSGFFIGTFKLKRDFSIPERVIKIIKAKMELFLQREKDFLWAYDANITGKIGERVVVLKENGNIQTYLVWGGRLRRYQKDIKILDN